MLKRETSKPQAPAIGALETVQAAVQYASRATYLVALVLAPFLLWGVFWDGILPAIQGKGAAGIHRELVEVLHGEGIRGAIILLLAVPPIAVIVGLPPMLEATARQRLRLQAADMVGGNGGDDAEDSPGLSGPRWDAAHHGLLQLSPQGHMTPLGIADQSGDVFTSHGHN